MLVEWKKCRMDSIEQEKWKGERGIRCVWRWPVRWPSERGHRMDTASWVDEGRHSRRWRLLLLVVWSVDCGGRQGNTTKCRWSKEWLAPEVFLTPIYLSKYKLLAVWLRPFHSIYLAAVSASLRWTHGKLWVNKSNHLIDENAIGKVKPSLISYHFIWKKCRKEGRPFLWCTRRRRSDFTIYLSLNIQNRMAKEAGTKFNVWKTWSEMVVKKLCSHMRHSRIESQGWAEWNFHDIAAKFGIRESLSLSLSTCSTKDRVGL